MWFKRPASNPWWTSTIQSPSPTSATTVNSLGSSMPISARMDYWVHADLLDTLMEFRTMPPHAGAPEIGGPLLDPQADGQARID